MQQVKLFKSVEAELSNLEKEVNNWISENLPKFLTDYNDTLYDYEEIKKYKASDGKIVEHFYFDDLTISILEHDFQPIKVKILTQEE